MPLMEFLNTYAPHLSYAMMVLFGLTCAMVVIGILFKISKTAIKWVVFTAIICSILLGAASGALYIWHWYYR